MYVYVGENWCKDPKVHMGTDFLTLVLPCPSHLSQHDRRTLQNGRKLIMNTYQIILDECNLSLTNFCDTMGQDGREEEGKEEKERQEVW